MLWGKKEVRDEDLPEDFRGKSPEEIKKILEEARQAQTMLETLKTEKDSLQTQFESQRTEFDSLKAKIAEMEAAQAQAQAQAAPATQEEPPSIWSDPERWHAERNKGVESVALMSGMLTARMVVENGLEDHDKKIWKKYSKEIDQTMQGFNPAQRTMPQSWMLALNVVKGNHMNEILKAQSEGNEFFAEAPSGSSPAPEPDSIKLTEQEQEACEKFHWDPKRYLAQKKKMVTSQSDKGSYAHFGME